MVVVVAVVCPMAAGCGQTTWERKIPFRNAPKPGLYFSISGEDKVFLIIYDIPFGHCGEFLHLAADPFLVFS